MTPDQLEKAMLEPAAVFATPGAVVNASGLTNEQKIEILRNWEYQAAEEAVALEEGMPGEESDLQMEIMVALGELTGSLDLERTSPSKQHGLSREAVKKSK